MVRERSRVRSPTMAQKYINNMENNFKFENKKNPESFSQEDIHAVFELHPELVSIGSEEEYVKYLGTIFPESKMVFRGDSKDLQTFQYSESKPENTGNLRMGPRLKYGSGIYFSSDNNLAKDFSIQNSGEIYTSLLDCSSCIAFTDRANLINTVKEFSTKKQG